MKTTYVVRTGSSAMNVISDGFAAALMRAVSCFICGTRNRDVRLRWAFVLTMAVFITQWPLTSSWIVVAPLTAVSMEGRRVKMGCTRDVSNLSVNWEFAPADTNKTSYIYTNREIPANLTSMYKIDTDNQTRYDLVIDSVNSSHAGTYICTPVVEGSAYASSASAQLVVLDSDPVCNTNTSASIGGSLEGDYLDVWCTVNYTGNWIPVMEWNDTHAHHTTYTTETHRETSSITLQLFADDDGTTISCKTSFNSQNYKHAREPREGETLANNIPNYQYTWTFKFSVLYAPKKITLTPKKSVYAVGERLVCWANGNPTPTYEWMEIETNRTTNGSILIMGNNLKTEKNHNFRCTAHNTVAGIERQIAETITFNVTDATSGATSTCMSTCMPLISVIALGFATWLSEKA